MLSLGDMTVATGTLLRVSPLIRRLVAPNPGPFTGTGTGTYVIGRHAVAVIDPGPDCPDHIDALLSGLGEERVSHIFVTHTHRDHSPASRPLQNRTGAPILAFGPHGVAQRQDLPPALAFGDVEEGADHDFQPDFTLSDGDIITGKGWELEAIWTPGHTSNHLCFAFGAERALFTGDHVMGWSSSIISPPDGDMGTYMKSLERVRKRQDAVLWPTHGPPIRNPRAHVEALIAHRKSREQGIMSLLRDGTDKVPAIVSALYTNLPKAMHPAAERSVLAHLVDLHDRGIIALNGSFDRTGRFRLRQNSP